MADLINASFEFIGALFIMLSVRRLYVQKLVRGIHWATTFYFSVWGLWNLYYYPSLDQWASFMGGVAICVTNTIYLGMIFYYVLKEKYNVEGLAIWPYDTAVESSDHTWGMGEPAACLLLDPDDPRNRNTGPAGRLRQRGGTSL